MDQMRWRQFLHAGPHLVSVATALIAVSVVAASVALHHRLTAHNPAHKSGLFKRLKMAGAGHFEFLLVYSVCKSVKKTK